MINANELRIGNLVHTSHKEQIGIGGVMNQEMELSGWEKQCVIVSYGGDFYKPEEIYPIPLSKQWLSKFQFKYLKVKGISSLEESHNEGDTHTWDLLVNENDIVDRFTFSLVKWGEQDYFTFSNQWLRVKVTTVHQLQNLFFSITGQELSAE